MHDSRHQAETMAPRFKRWHDVCNLCLRKTDVWCFEMRCTITGRQLKWGFCPTCIQVMREHYDHTRKSDDGYRQLWMAIGLPVPDESGRESAKRASIVRTGH